MSPRPTTNTRPSPPRLPSALEDAAGELAAFDSWYGVAAGAYLAVDAEVADAELIECTFTDVDLSGRVLTGLRGRDLRFSGCDLSGASLDGAVLDRVEFVGCRLTGTMLTGARLADVRIVDCSADLLNLRATLARRLLVESTSATEAELYTADLSDSALLDCDLSRSHFDQVRIENVALHGSTLDDIHAAVSLAGATIDADQALPLGAALLAGLGIRVADRPAC